MHARILMPTNNYSYFIFGPRGSGKTFLLRNLPDIRNALWIDLLNAEEESIFEAHPGELLDRTKNLPQNSRVVIDEVQKAPKLLDLVHKLIEENKLLFSLSGSSARKLKRGAANLLAGRAFIYHLFPFSFLEVPDFDLTASLEWGMLPKIREFSALDDRKNFLKAYAHTYLQEEIKAEQIVRNLPAFRRFLEVAAQMNGQPINCSKIGRDIHADHTVVRNFYEILEDTLVGFHLPAYDLSVRRQLRKAPKFYLFDPGVKRALDKTLDIPLQPQTHEFGKAFEHFLVLEFFKLSHYRNRDESLFYLQTKNGVEIDLVMTRPGRSTLFIEIKSTTNIGKEDATPLREIAASLPDAQTFLLSRDPHAKAFDRVQACYWEDFLRRYFEDQLTAG